MARKAVRKTEQIALRFGRLDPQDQPEHDGRGGRKGLRMTASEIGKAPKADSPQVKAREARLAQALRANLRRRKGSDALPPPSPTQAAPHASD
jgi:hypothetical protein